MTRLSTYLNASRIRKARARLIGAAASVWALYPAMAQSNGGVPPGPAVTAAGPHGTAVTAVVDTAAPRDSSPHRDTGAAEGRSADLVTAAAREYERTGI